MPTQTGNRDYPGTESSLLLKIALVGMIFMLLAVSMLLNAQTSGGDTKTSGGKDESAKKGFHTPAERLAAMKMAEIYKPAAPGDADIMTGPKQDPQQFQLHYGDKVICDFATPGREMGGKTQKFGCRITSVVSNDGKTQTLTPGMKDSDPVKVKFGADDNEVYAEIASTRLLWALGYYADSWFPVKVECHNCPANVVAGTGAAGTKIFDPAIIVRKFDWKKMTEIGKEEEGWSWKELDADNGRPTYERDGLKLMAAFLQHSDNKPPQQRLVCDHVSDDGKTTACDKSVMLVQDVGATWGSGGLFTSNTGAKMNIENWSSHQLWNSAGKDGEPRHCVAGLRNSLTGKDGLKNPSISEEGRRFDAGLLCQLSDQQIEELFRASRAAQMPKYHNRDGSFKAGVDEAKVVQQWVTAFKAKREELAAARCEWKEKPADLAAVDNPAKLGTVPDHCTAKLF